jgi:hypothetical protein
MSLADDWAALWDLFCLMRILFLDQHWGNNGRVYDDLIED